MTAEKTGTIVDPVDVQIGGGADAGTFGDSIAADDIEAVLQSPQPLHERRAELETMRRSLQARANADRGEDTQALLAEVDRALGMLTSAPAGSASRAGLGLDPDSRSDAAPAGSDGEEDRG